MKTVKIFGLITAMIFSFVSCEESEDPAGVRGEGIVPAIIDLNPAIFDSNDIENTYVQFTLDSCKTIDEAIIVVSYNGDLSRAEVVRHSTFPATVQLQLATVATKLGKQLSDIELGDVFTFEVLTVLNGKTYSSNAVINVALVCGYDPELVTGSYRAQSADWNCDGNVTITVDPDNQYIVYVTGLASMEGLVEDQGPLKMIIDPLDYSVVAEKTVLASDILPWELTYTNYYYEGTGNLNTCNGTYTMVFVIGVDQGDWGSNNFLLTKN